MPKVERDNLFNPLSVFYLKDFELFLKEEEKEGEKIKEGLDSLKSPIASEPIDEGEFASDYDAAASDATSEEVTSSESVTSEVSDITDMGQAAASETPEPPEEPSPEPSPEPEPKPEPAPTPNSFYFDVPLSHDLQNHIRNLCIEYGVPMELCLAIIEIESDFTPNLVSRTNDYGLMQINVCHHSEMRKMFRITDFLDPYQNVLCGIFLISRNISDAGGDYHWGLMKYNMGDWGAQKRRNKGQYTTTYSRKVMNAYEKYKDWSAL